MALNLKLGTAFRTTLADAAADWHDGGTPPGKIEHRVGTPPTNPGDASSGALLGTNLFANPAFPAASAGVATANAIVSDSSADDSGTAGYFRVYQGGGADTAAGYQGTSGASGDTPNLVFDNPVFVAGGIIAISDWALTMPIGP